MKNVYRNLINCEDLSLKLQKRIAFGVYDLGDNPQIATITVANNIESLILNINNADVFSKTDIMSVNSKVPSSITTNELIDLVEFYNRSEDINGILVSLPLPGHIDTMAVLSAINPLKDVSGLSIHNLGMLMANNEDGLVPFTPAGILEIIKYSMPNYTNKKALILGGSELFSRTLSMLLQNNNMIVLNTNPTSQDDIKIHIHNFKPDVLITAVGVRNLIDVDTINNTTVKTFIDCSTVVEEDFADIVGDFNKEQYSELDKTGIQWTTITNGITFVGSTMLADNLLKAYKLQEEAWYNN